MATQGPTTTAGATPAIMTSRLAQMQMRFQQRQQQERDQRKVEMISTASKTATSSSSNTTVTHGGTGSSNSTVRSSAISAYTSTTVSGSHHSPSGSGTGDLSATLGAGKVRQMFDERRAHHRVTGIDKSYPLQPIQSKAVASNNNNCISNGVANGNTAKSTAGTAGAGLNNKTRVPPISANTKARFAMQPRQQDNGNDETGKNSTFDDNENFLEDEKFPDTISFDDDPSSSLAFGIPTGNHPITRKPTSTNKSGGPAQNVNSLKLKPVPGRVPLGTGIKQPTATKPVSKKQPSPTAAQPTTASAAQSSPTRGGSSSNSAKSSPSRPSTGKSVMASASSITRKSPVAPSTVVDGPVPEGLTRCDICSRNFADDRIAKHREICKKTKSKKRKVFDTTKHRVAGTEAEKYVAKKKPGVSGSKKSIAGAPAGPAAAAGGAEQRKSDWRRKHEEFIQAIRAAKEMKAYLAKGGKLSDLPPPPPSENPDYIQCPHCSRRFNQTAAERHIPKCATMLHNKPKPNQPKGKRF
ncbi:nuclear pore complex protein DDB_G0274915 isoform X1 [Wyeomyia smithii]|uniref:nuclear pore complex protein DDB_G0274915 isoform X1 n=2 Tax=Wyeomyia smithii TaxID=174621 RepID=UPI002467D4FC|nr:nuclear pore complex protein DDB_G0274915 isoform X1 [Wyeomyia smithii]XP_055551524.1 nuclear pore complex protein DDB_G0274915 isoform X1 [Wyeomyia smithii]